MGAGDEREGSEEVCIWQLRRHKGKQTTCFAEKPLSCCTIDACYYWPTLSILLHKGKQPLSTQLNPTTYRRCLSAPQQLCSVASEDFRENAGNVSKLRDCLGYGEEQCNLLFSSSTRVLP